MDFSLQHGLASGHERKFCRVRLNCGKDLRDRHFASFCEGIFGVTVSTTQIAGRKTDEGTGPAHKARFPLDAIENLVYFHARQTSTGKDQLTIVPEYVSFYISYYLSFVISR